MSVDLSLAALVYSGSGALFALVGLFCLAAARGSARALVLGVLATAFGVRPALSNILKFEGLEWLYLSLNLVAAGACAILVLDLARGLNPRGRRALAGCVLLLAAAQGVLMLSVTLGRGEPLFRQAPFSSGLVALALMALVAVCGLRYAALPAGARRERRALAYLAIGFGLHSFVWLAPGPASWPTLGPPFAAAVAVTAVWILGTRGPDGAPARNVLLALCGVGTLALLLVGPLRPYVIDVGNNGIARIVGFVFLVVAIVRDDLLGVPLPRRASVGGPLAAGALASLLIVAQIAQNFLSAQFGLLMGGIVAGAFLVAAHPIQRAFERITGDRPAATVPRDDSAAEASYLLALRLALRDRVLTREEERGLVVLAHDLGIPPRRAHELQDTVALELGGPR